ncbi:MAG: hypothetical protein ACXAEI_04495 [Candidatus Hodarchaeales archaeon]|jgi:hypothetical protein
MSAVAGFFYEGKALDQYDVVPSHVKTVLITNSTQTDVPHRLFTVEQWGKFVYNLTWDGNPFGVNVVVNFWTLELAGARQAAYGDLGHDWVCWFRTAVVDSCRCEEALVKDSSPPITIYYDLDASKNANHNIEAGAVLILHVEYFYFSPQEDARPMVDSGTIILGGLVALGTIAIGALFLYRRRATKILFP